MADAPALAVVVPTLNEAAFIREALDGLMAQNYPNLQVTAYDGGSTDGTIEILRSYPIEVEVEPGLGQMAAINRGWRRTTAEFVTWMAGDDRLWLGALARLAQALRDNPQAAAAHADARIVDEGGKPIGQLRPGNVQLRELAFEFTLVPQTSLIRRTALERSGAFDESLRLAADHDLFLRLAQYYPLVYVPFLAADYRVHAGSQDAHDQFAVGQATVAVVTRFFQRGDLSAEQLAMRAHALAGANLFAGTCLCLAHRRREAWPFWWRAAKLDSATPATRRGMGLLLRLLSPIYLRPYQARAFFPRWPPAALNRGP
jgi:glycosyltransferase involved in cell wall biosynthesis